MYADRREADGKAGDIITEVKDDSFICWTIAEVMPNGISYLDVPFGVSGLISRPPDKSIQCSTLNGIGLILCPTIFTIAIMAEIGIPLNIHKLV